MIEISKMIAIYIYTVHNVNYVRVTVHDTPLMPRFHQKLNSAPPLLKWEQSGYPSTSNYISSQIW